MGDPTLTTSVTRLPHAAALPHPEADLSDEDGPEGTSRDGKSRPTRASGLPSRSQSNPSRIEGVSSRTERRARYTHSASRDLARVALSTSRLNDSRELRATNSLSLSRCTERLPRNAERPASIDQSVPRFND